MIRLLPLLLLAGCSPEYRIDDLQSENAELRAIVERQQREIDRLYENDEAVRQNFNHLGKFHGIDPLPPMD